MFGKKKAPGIPVMHYEGLDFPQDFPCRIELAGDNLTVTRIKPDQTGVHAEIPRGSDNHNKGQRNPEILFGG